MKISFCCFNAAFATVLCSAIAYQTCRAQGSQSPLSWPEVPEEIGRRVAPIAGPVIGPEAVLPKNDTVQVLNTSQRFKGLLTYSAVIKDADDNEAPSLLLRGIGFQRLLENKPSPVARYIVNQVEGNFYNPQWSPDGKNLSYKVAIESARTFYQLFVWDFAANERFLVSKRPSIFASTFWSPGSSSIAYIAGFNFDTGGRRYEQPLELFAFNLNTKSERKLAVNVLPQHPLDSSAEPSKNAAAVAWTTKGSILYTKKHTLSARLAAKYTRNRADYRIGVHTDIYEVNAHTGKTQLIIGDGFSPAPSPDNQWIAFLGHKDKVDSPKFRPYEIGVCLYHRATKKRIWLRPLATKTSKVKNDNDVSVDLTDFPTATLRWSPDNRRLILVETRSPQYGQKTSIGDANIIAWNISNDISPTHASQIGASRKIAFFEVQSSLSSNFFDRTIFRALQVSKDSSALFLEQLSPKILFAVDLNDGKRFDIAYMQNPNSYYGDWDWLETAP